MKTGRRAFFTALALAAVIPSLVIAATGFRLRPPVTRDHDDQPIDQPRRRGISDLYNIVDNTWLRHLSPEIALEKDHGALNVNAWDQAPDSSWFTNRIGVRSMSFEEILSGLEGRAPQPSPWYVRRRNDSGYTPKIDIRDSASTEYVLKFDPKGARERNSAAERIGTLILHAAGYNVPYNVIVYFDAMDLRFDAKSEYRDPFNKAHTLTQADVDAVLQGLDPMPDGKYRGIASQRIPGDAALDPFRFTGQREDDKNDIIPHELRRELRGLGVVAAWINHVDIKDNQALDMFVKTAGDKGYVKHYLLDFSATLGAYEWPIDPLRVGHEYMFDAAAMGKSFVTLGFWRRPWRNARVEHSEVGYFSADLFEPDKWKPSFPNIAFERMDDSDGYWGAKIVTAFTEDTLGKIAAEGAFLRPEVTRYVHETLRRRQEAIGKYWFNRVTPVEEIQLRGVGSATHLQFRDIGVERGYVRPASRSYRFWLETLDGRKVSDYSAASSTDLVIPGLSEAISKYFGGPTDKFGRTPVLRLLIQSNQEGGKWALPVEVVIGRVRGDFNLQALGWFHAPRK